ncbi:hypothetical protein MASR2M48_24520 [Spirochaetota bacterium]
MKVQILGSGCPKCKLLEQHARDAIEELGIEAEVEKVSDPDTILEMGVMMTPAAGHRWCCKELRQSA